MQALVPVELDHKGAHLIGQAALPEGSGPHPAVLVMHNALGIGDHLRGVTAKLAALGYVAVATDMYGGDTPAGDIGANSKEFRRVMQEPRLLRERVVAWFDRVSAMPEVDAGRVAAIGFCFGGTCVLELARSGAAAKAVVSYHGILTSAAPMQPGAFSGEVAAFCGGRDPYAPMDHIEGLRSELASAGARHTITTFGEAQHGFTDPAADSMGREGIAFDAMAARVSWAATEELLAVALGQAA